MADTVSNGQSPLEAWSKLIQSTLEGYSAGQALTRPSQESEKDPWIALIDQLWRANPYSKLLPIDPAEITRAFQQIWLDAVRNPGRAWTTYLDFVGQSTQSMTTATLKFWGGDQDAESVVEPEKGDKRFSAPDWQQNPIFDTLKQSYLLAATTLLKTAAEIEGLDERQQRKLMFYLRQFLDAISPTNVLFTNPQVIHETITSGGQNLVKGMEHLLRDLKAGQIKMTDTTAFAPGRNLALTAGQVIYRNKLIELIQYAPTTEKVYAIPLLFIPPWINKYYILDMQPHNSLIKFLVDSGFTVFVISWKNPDASMEDTTFEDYLTVGRCPRWMSSKRSPVRRRSMPWAIASVGRCSRWRCLIWQLRGMGRLIRRHSLCRGRILARWETRRSSLMSRRSRISRGRCWSGATWIAARCRRCSTCYAPTI